MTVLSDGTEIQRMSILLSGKRLQRVSCQERLTRFLRRMTITGLLTLAYLVLAHLFTSRLHFFHPHGDFIQEMRPCEPVKMLHPAMHEQLEGPWAVPTRLPGN